MAFFVGVACQKEASLYTCNGSRPESSKAVGVENTAIMARHTHQQQLLLIGCLGGLCFRKLKLSNLLAATEPFRDQRQQVTDYHRQPKQENRSITHSVSNDV